MNKVTDLSNNIYCSKDSIKIIEKCKTLKLVPFCWGRHVQIILYSIKDYFQKLINPTYWTSELCILPDGEEVTIDWAIPCKLSNDEIILIINPGSLGHTKTLMGQWVKRAHSRGWSVCVHNRRGHDKLLTRPQWNFFGSSNDIKYIADVILKRRPNAKLILLGLSAGSGVVSRTFGEENPFCGAVCVSAGFGIEKSIGRVKFPYNYLLLSAMKNFLKNNETILKNVLGFRECMQSKNPQEFLDNSYAMAGYPSITEYYNNTCALKTVKNIQKPILFINAEDDPIAIKENFVDIKNLDKGSAIFVSTPVGSHCAFLDHFMDSWSEKVVFEFFETILHKTN
jgi:predicted alpha/beta-fold hydrolase